MNILNWSLRANDRQLLSTSTISLRYWFAHRTLISASMFSDSEIDTPFYLYLLFVEADNKHNTSYSYMDMKRALAF